MNPQPLAIFMALGGAVVVGFAAVWARKLAKRMHVTPMSPEEWARRARERARVNIFGDEATALVFDETLIELQSQCDDVARSNTAMWSQSTTHNGYSGQSFVLEKHWYLQSLADGTWKLLLEGAGIFFRIARFYIWEGPMPPELAQERAMGFVTSDPERWRAWVVPDRGPMQEEVMDAERRLQFGINDIIATILMHDLDDSSAIHVEIGSNDMGEAEVRLESLIPEGKPLAKTDGMLRSANCYIRLVKQSVPDWKRTWFVLRDHDSQWSWNVMVDRG